MPHWTENDFPLAAMYVVPLVRPPHVAVVDDGALELEVVVAIVAVELRLVVDVADEVVCELRLGIVVPGLVYAQASLPLNPVLRYKARGSPLVMVMARLPDASATKTLQVSKSVYLLFA